MTPASWLKITPDCVCDVLSPSTRTLKRGTKLPLYAQHGVAHAWPVEPRDRLVEVLRLDGNRYRIVRTATGDAAVSLGPFEALDLDLAVPWTL